MDCDCCFANQDKFWVEDPDGREWEIYVLNRDLDEPGGRDEEACCAEPEASGDADKACSTEVPAAADSVPRRARLSEGRPAADSVPRRLRNVAEQEQIMKTDTLLVHAGGGLEPDSGAIAPSIHLSTTFEHTPDGEATQDHVYIRMGNPTQDRLEEALAAIEGRREVPRLRVGHGSRNGLRADARPRCPPADGTRTCTALPARSARNCCRTGTSR